MKNKIRITLILAAFLANGIIKADAVVTFFLRPYPIIMDKKECELLVEKLKRPGRIAKYCVYGLIDTSITIGIFATYAGYLNASDPDGRIIFPRKHTKDFVKLLVTNKITPIIMAENTIHHWEIEKGTPATMYHVERKQDLATELFYWSVMPVDLPANNRVPREAVVLLAKPHHVHVPIGITLASDNPNLLLPDIYVKKGIAAISNALYLLNLRHFFGQLGVMLKKEKGRYQIKVTG